MIARSLALSLILALITSFAIGCGGEGGGADTPDALLSDATDAMADENYDKALVKFDEAIAAMDGADAAKLTDAKVDRIECIIRTGDGAKGQEQFAALVKTDGDAIDWKAHKRIAEALVDEGHNTPAIDVLHNAEQTFPDHKESFLAVIEAIKSKPMSGADEEKLRKLGYIQ